jgi:hypothetical protein
MESLGFDLLEIEKLRLDFEPYSHGYEEDESDEVEESDGYENTRSSAAPSSPDESDSKKLGSPIIQYTIVFNDENEQALWYGYLRQLKTKYPEASTISERLIKDIEQLNGTL